MRDASILCATMVAVFRRPSDILYFARHATLEMVYAIIWKRLVSRPAPG